MESQYNLRNPGVKRLMREAQELRDPTELYFAQPIQDNLFEWHFTIRGPSDSEFDGGFYHGRISLPPDYPLKPPSVLLLTPNGRFEVNRKICLSISGHHPESWQPSWSSVHYVQTYTARSHDWVCPDCGGGPIHKHLLPLQSTAPTAPAAASPKATSSAESELISRISFKAETPAEAAAAAKSVTTSTTASSAPAAFSATAAASSASPLPDVPPSASTASPPASAWPAWANAFGGGGAQQTSLPAGGVPLANAGAPYGAFPFPFAMPMPMQMQMPAFLPPPPPPPPPEVLEQWLRYLGAAFQQPIPASAPTTAAPSSAPTSVLPAPSATATATSQAASSLEPTSTGLLSSGSSVASARFGELGAGSTSAISLNEPLARSDGEPDREQRGAATKEQQQQKAARVSATSSSGVSSRTSTSASGDKEPIRVPTGSGLGSGSSELRHRHPERLRHGPGAGPEEEEDDDVELLAEMESPPAHESASSSSSAHAPAEHLPQDLAGEAEPHQAPERDPLLPFIKALIVAIVLLVSLRLLDVVW